MDVHFSHLCGWDVPWKEAIKTAAGHQVRSYLHGIDSQAVGLGDHVAELGAQRCRSASS